jgi:drug/metabolite transporter (DMT)-like permease
MTLINNRLKSDVSLLLAAIVWGSAFVPCRVAAQQVGTFLFNGLRFLVGSIVLLLLVWPRLRHTTRTELWGGALAGALILVASALQQAGLQYTTAGKAGFITGLYVVIVPVLLALVWRHWPHWSAWLASGLAVAGLFLLSGVETIALSPGDGLELAGAAMFALHVIVIAKLANKVDALLLALTQYVVCGLVSLLAGMLVEPRTAGQLASVWWAILYTGVFSIGLAYTLQIVGQRHAPPTDAAIILSSEAVFAALSGWLLLQETLTVQQIWGCGLMLAGMLLAQVRRLPGAV